MKSVIAADIFICSPPYLKTNFFSHHLEEFIQPAAEALSAAENPLCSLM